MDINVQHLKGEQRKGRVRCQKKSKEVVSYCIDWDQQPVCECFIFLVFSNIVYTQFYLIDFTTRPHFHLQICYAVSSFFVCMWVCACACARAGTRESTRIGSLAQILSPCRPWHVLTLLICHSKKGFWARSTWPRMQQAMLHTHREAAIHFSKMSPRTDVTSVIDSGKDGTTTCTSIDIISPKYHWRQQWIIEANNVIAGLNRHTV